MEILKYIYGLILKAFDFMKSIDIFDINMFVLYLSYAIITLFLIWFFVFDDDDN